jgi:ribosomal protein S18 acetylase RimI-like enzyme
MIFKENPILELTDYKRIAEIFLLVEWESRSTEDIQSTFDKSTFTSVIWEDGKIIGFGRTFDDGKYYATICDVAIDPKYQGQGYGKKIVENLKTRLAGYLFITLTAAPGKGEFYEKMGWKNQTSAYIAPVSEKQQLEHT